MTDVCPIIVDVKVEYSAEHSQPAQNRFVFIYDITIRNVGDQAAQLLTRHWLITDSNGMVEEVMGEGVIGELPVISPGGEHRYNSFCVLETSVGYMQGSYQMIAKDGETFDAPVAAFMLAVPGALN